MGPSVLSIQVRMGRTERAKALTMLWNRVYPLVQRRVQFGNNMLLPLLADEPEQRLRLIDRILYAPLRLDNWTTEREGYSRSSARRRRESGAT